jgi:plasmid stabilization system protein ParE
MIFSENRYPLFRITRYRPGRVVGTREMVVRPNYLVIYTESARAVTILRVLHAAQQWPPTQE